MAAVAGVGGGRRQRRRLPLADLTNVSTVTCTSRLTRAQAKPCASSSSSIGSSPTPAILCPPPPPRPPVVPEIKGKHKSAREIPISSSHLKKIKEISSSKPKVKKGDPLSVAPSRKTRKVMPPLYTSSNPKEKTGDMLPVASSSPSKIARKRTKEQQHSESLDLGDSVGFSQANIKFIEEKRAYFAEIDAFELAEEFVSSGDLE